VKPSTPRPLPVRLKELAGKSRWMNWEPPSGCPCEGRRSHPYALKNRRESFKLEAVK